MQAELRKLIDDRNAAICTLKIISTWARRMRLSDPLDAAKDAQAIHQRALDTLRLMGESK